MKTTICITIDTGKRKPTKVTGYHFGQDKIVPMAFNDNSFNEFEKSRITKYCINVIKESLRNDNHKIEK